MAPAIATTTRSLSFFSTLEFALLMHSDWHTRDETKRAVFRTIETWYNRKRRHSTLGYVSPAEHEAELKQAAQSLLTQCPQNRGKLKQPP